MEIFVWRNTNQVWPKPVQTALIDDFDYGLLHSDVVWSLSVTSSQHFLIFLQGDLNDINCFPQQICLMLSLILILSDEVDFIEKITYSLESKHLYLLSSSVVLPWLHLWSGQSAFPSHVLLFGIVNDSPFGFQQTNSSKITSVLTIKNVTNVNLNLRISTSCTFASESEYI